MERILERCFFVIGDSLHNEGYRTQSSRVLKVIGHKAVGF